MATTYTGYSLYTYTGANNPAGMVGRITDNGTAITPTPNLVSFTNTTPGSGDPQIEGYVNGSALQLAVAPYTGSTEAVQIFDAATGSAVASRTWASVNNMYGVVRIGAYLYVLDYDAGRVVEVNASSYNQTGTVFDFNANAVTKALLPTGYKAHGQAIVVIGSTLYGLFAVANSSFTAYANSVLVKFTIAAGSAISVGSTNYNANFGKNAFAMAVQGSDLYVASIGGYQNGGAPNTGSALQKIAYAASPLNTATVTKVFGYSAAYPYEVRDISFNGTTAYVLVGTYDSGYVMRGKLLQTTTAFASFATINDFSGGAPGYLWSAQYVDNDRILFARGNAILYYNAASTATPVATLTITPGSLEASGTSYTNLNDITYVGAKSTGAATIRGYRSPTQALRTARAAQARAIAQGRPELTEEERERLDQA